MIYLNTEISESYTPEEIIRSSTESDKQDLFDLLVEQGFSIDEEETPSTILEKRYMMDKSDDDMLMYLIEKYQYFG